MRIFKALLARALEAKTEEEINVLCADIDRAFDSDKIKYDEHELLYRVVRKIYR